MHRLDFDFEATIAALEEEAARATGGAGETRRERALVIGLVPSDEHFAETLELVRSAGVEIAGQLRQKRSQVHPKTVVGRGKLQEIVLEGMRRRAEVAIFDIDLKPAQARAFEDATGMKAVDRTQLILDIFAQRARSRDGKLQVELAQLKYSLPRLTDQDAGLSRLTGGIGGRGPGETVMEIGRRRIRDRIRALEKQVEQLSRQRDVRRRRRRDKDLPILSIIGYTNAGKSTLLNAMTNSEVEAADKLFMTLDPTSRRLRFPREGEVIVTDTVGFLADLPEDLVAAFRATLEELADADLLLHVVDASDPRLEEKRAAVEKLVEELDLGEIDRLVVLNKTDLVPEAEIAALVRRFDGVAVSALRRRGFDALIHAAEERLGRNRPLLDTRGDAGGGGSPSGRRVGPRGLRSGRLRRRRRRALTARSALRRRRSQLALQGAGDLAGDAQVQVGDLAPVDGHRVAHQGLGGQALALLEQLRRALEVGHGEEELRQPHLQRLQHPLELAELRQHLAGLVARDLVRPDARTAGQLSLAEAAQQAQHDEGLPEAVEHSHGREEM